MLDDRAGRLVELAHAFPGRIGVGDIVVGELLALVLPCAGQAALRRMEVTVPGGLLVRVLAVAQVGHLDETGIGLSRKVSRFRLQSGREVIADGVVVLRDAVEGSHRQIITGFPIQRADRASSCSSTCSY